MQFIVLYINQPQLEETSAYWGHRFLNRSQYERNLENHTTEIQDPRRLHGRGSHIRLHVRRVTEDGPASQTAAGTAERGFMSFFSKKLPHGFPVPNAFRERLSSKTQAPTQKETLDGLQVLRAARAELILKRNRLEKQIYDVQRRQEKRRQETESEHKP